MGNGFPPTSGQIPPTSGSSYWPNWDSYKWYRPGKGAGRRLHIVFVSPIEVKGSRHLWQACASLHWESATPCLIDMHTTLSPYHLLHQLEWTVILQLSTLVTQLGGSLSADRPWLPFFQWWQWNLNLHNWEFLLWLLSWRPPCRCALGNCVNCFVSAQWNPLIAGKLDYFAFLSGTSLVMWNSPILVSQRNTS